jgi:vitamin B12 transporter
VGAALLGLCAAGAAVAQAAAASTEAGHRLDTVVVTATRTPLRVDDSLADVTVIRREDLQAATGRSLAEILAQQSGLSMDASGGPGQLSAVRIRGMEARHTVLLVDGVRHGSLTSTAAPWQNLPLDAIERIEIVRGPLSSLYGADAAGGVIQVFTRAAGTGESGRVLAHGVWGAGTHRQRQLGAGLRLTQDEVDLHLDLHRERTEGFSATNERAPFGVHEPDDDGMARDHAAVRWVWRMAPRWRAELASQVSDNDLAYDNAPSVGALARSISRLTSVQLVTEQQAFRSVLRASYSGERFIDVQGGFGDIGSTQAHWTWENTVPLPMGTLLGVLERTQQDVSPSSTDYTVKRRHITGVALGWNGRFENLTWQTSVRQDRNSQFGSARTGTLSLAADANEVWRLGASVGTSFVAPDFASLYFPGSENPDLQPERGAHREVSVQARVPYGRWRLAWFDNHLRDAFAFSLATFTTQNIARTRSTGWSLGGEAEWAAWRLTAAFDWTDPRNAAPDSPDVGRLLPRRAQRSARLGADWRGGAVRAGAALQGTSHRVESSGERMAGYATLDLHAGWQVAPEWALALRLNNAADRVYETAYGYNQPGREVFLTLRYEGR